MTCHADTIIGSLNPNCGSTYIELPLPVVADCSENISITNNSVYADSNEGSASGVYPLGVHSIIYTVEDGCGNQSTCSATLTVVDGLIPSVSCISEITVNIGSDSTATITPEMIDYGSFDNCTATNNLNFSVAPNIFSCADLGSQTVVLTVTDEVGNVAECTTTVDVQNNGNICPSNSVILEGQILSEKGTPIPGTTVFLSGDLTEVATTNEDGFYTFENVPARWKLYHSSI